MILPRFPRSSLPTLWWIVGVVYAILVYGLLRRAGVGEGDTSSAILLITMIVVAYYAWETGRLRNAAEKQLEASTQLHTSAAEQVDIMTRQLEIMTEEASRPYDLILCPRRTGSHVSLDKEQGILTLHAVNEGGHGQIMQISARRWDVDLQVNNFRGPYPVRVRAGDWVKIILSYHEGPKVVRVDTSFELQFETDRGQVKEAIYRVFTKAAGREPSGVVNERITFENLPSRRI